MKKVRLFILFFALVLITPNVYASEYKTGTYKIHSAINDDLLLVEKDGNIELGDANSTGTTTWDVYADGTTFYIKSSTNNKAADVAGANYRNGTNIQVYDANGTDAQKWKLQSANNSYYFITTANGRFNMDVSNGAGRVGNNIQIWSYAVTPAQMWRLERLDESTQTIEDGTYTIRSFNNNKNVLDLAGGYTKNSTNVQVYTNNFTWAQLWNVKYENGYYTISTYLDNNKVLDLAGANFKNGTNIQVYESNGSNAQKWIIQANNDGTYSVLSYDGLWKVDISGGSTKPLANIQIFQPNGTPAQNFIFEKTSIEFLENGYYVIDSLVGNNMVLGINDVKAVNGKNVIITNNNDIRSKKWYIKRIDRDIYTIGNAQNKNKVLDVAGGSSKDGTNVQLYQSNGTNAQKWIIRKNSDNTYSFYGVGSEKALDVYNGNSVEGTNIQIYTPNNGNSQKFNITSIVENDYEYVDPGKYIIKSNLSQNKALDVAGGAKDNNTNIQLWDANNTKAQVWKIEDAGNGKYVVRSMLNPKTVLTATSSNVVLKKYTDSDDQKWFFYKDNSDVLNLYNVGQGRYLKIEGTTAGNNVSLSDEQTNKNGIALSQFNQSLSYRGVDISSHNGNVNWELLKNRVDFVIIRAGISSEVIQDNKDIYQDSKFLTNVEKCEEYNIPYALYLYSYANKINGADNSAESEADHILKLVNKAKSYGGPNLSVPVYYDVEDKTTFSALNYQSIYSLEDRFCSIVENNGYQCGLYMSYDPFKNMGNNTKTLASKYGIWVAQWKWKNFTSDENQFHVLNNPSDYYNHSDFESYFGTKEKLWQYSAEGNIPGANTGEGRIDLNIGYDIFE